MLKQYPTLRYVLQKGFWYFLTFIVAVALNFALPRLGENNPVDIVMGKAAQGLSPEEAMQKKETLLKAFGMAELDDSGNLIYDTIPEVDAAGKAVLDENGQLKKAVTPRSRRVSSAGFLAPCSVPSRPTSAAFLTRSFSRWQCS